MLEVAIIMNHVLDGLQCLSIPRTPTTLGRLVRGLDYYHSTVWEIVYTENNVLGESQATILAGGRYDGLLKAFGGPADIPCIG